MYKGAGCMRGNTVLFLMHRLLIDYMRSRQHVVLVAYQEGHVLSRLNVVESHDLLARQP